MGSKATTINAKMALDPAALAETDTFSISVEAAAKVIAAASSVNGWGANTSQAFRAVDAYKRNGDVFPEGIGLRTGAQWRAIVAILEDRYTGNSPKWSAFSANILGAKDAVTVDRHAMRVAMADGVKYDAITLGNYRKVAEAYRIAADARNIDARDMQAIVWVSYRNRVRNSNGRSLSELYDA